MKKIFYVDKEELNLFINSSEITKEGYGYEWENEDVIHLHINPVLHAYGKQHNIVFTKNNIINRAEGYNYVIGVDCDDTSIKFVKDAQLTDVDGEINYIPAKAELYSRNKGILEIGILENKRVMIVGLGSFGSQIAIELAKAGVGNFALFPHRVQLRSRSGSCGSSFSRRR